MLHHYQFIAERARELGGRASSTIALLPTAHLNGLHPRLPYRAYICRCFQKLGCDTTEILIGTIPPSEQPTDAATVAQILAESQALFVLGGDTRYLLRTVAEQALGPLFTQAYERGLLFSGSSAGLIWLATRCMSDSESYTNADEWRFVMLEGMGFIPLAVNVHDDQGVAAGVRPATGRRTQFETQLRRLNEPLGLAVDEFAAVDIAGGRCSVRTPGPQTGAYLLAEAEGELRRRRIEGTVDLLDKAALSRYVKGQ